MTRFLELIIFGIIPLFLSTIAFGEGESEAQSTAANSVPTSTETAAAAVAPSYKKWDADVAMTSRYIYNVFYDFDGAVSDEAVTITPHLAGNSYSGLFTVKGDADGFIENYISKTVQSHIDYSGKFNAAYNETGKLAFRMTGKYRSFSDPSPSESYGRIGRATTEGTLESKIKGDKNDSLEIKFLYKTEAFKNPLNNNNKKVLADYLNNDNYELNIQYNTAFLPETYWFVAASAGMIHYPRGDQGVDPTAFGTGSPPYIPKVNSNYYSADIGLDGRLTDKSTINCTAGFLSRQYNPSDYQRGLKDSSDDSYNLPVFKFKFTEQISRHDQLLAGYEKSARDSYFTNYVTEDQIYIGLARVLGDQVLFLGHINYYYRTFSLPARRDDERIAAALTLKYSLTAKVKLTADLVIDLLSSDAYDGSQAPSNPDRPASYKAGSFGLGLVAYY